MLTTLLLNTLLEVERSVGRLDALAVRRMLMEAQQHILGIEQERIALLREIQQLREENAGRAAQRLCRVQTVDELELKEGWEPVAI